MTRANLGKVWCSVFLAAVIAAGCGGGGDPVIVTPPAPVVETPPGNGNDAGAGGDAGTDAGDGSDAGEVGPLTATAGAAQTVCPGGSVTLGGAATGGVAPYTYAWTASPACADCLSALDVASPTANPSVTTTFTQTVTDALGATATASVVVTPGEALPPVSGSLTLQPGASVRLGESAAQGATYHWTCNRADCALSAADEAQPLAAPTLSTRYTLEATHASSCVSQGSITVNVSLEASTEPQDGALAHPFDADLFVQFSQPVLASSVTAANVQLVDTLSGASVPVTLTLDAPNRLRVHPNAELAHLTDYTLTLVGGEAGLVSDDAVLPNVLASDVLVDFTTSDLPDTTAPAIAFRSPEASATGVASNTTVTVGFNEPIDPASVTETTFTLSSAGGAVAGSVRFDTETSTATFTPAASLAFDTGYTVNLAGVMDLSGNALTTAWTFTTGAFQDLVAPTVTAVTPADGAVSVISTTQVTLTFSEAVDASTLGGITLSLVSDGTQVAGAVAYNATTRVVTFTPAQMLASESEYAVEASGVKDLAGNAMETAFVSHFTTRRTLFSDDFESGTGKWELATPAVGPAWALSSKVYHAGRRSLCDGSVAKYANNVTSYAALAAPIDVTGLDSVSVLFWLRARLEKKNDTVSVEASLDGGAWTPVAGGTYSGNAGWTARSLSLSVTGATSLRLRFVFKTNGTRVFDGVYVDDILVQTP